MSEEIQALRRLTVPELAARYQEVYGRPPRIRHKEWLWKRIAYRLQEERTGGLSKAAQVCLEALIAAIDIPLEERTRTVLGRSVGPVGPREPVVGTILVRPYQGREIRATRVAEGWEWDGGVYASLSAVALAVTGSKWNGRLFFGLTKRERGK